MPLWSGEVIAFTGSRLSGASSCHGEYYRRRTRLPITKRGSKLLLPHPARLQSAQTWSSGAPFELPGGRGWSNCRAMAEEQEELLDSLEQVSTEFVEAEATGSVFGAVALITGTSVGAGILALPAITAPIGFTPSATIMGLSWAFLLLEALLLAEVNVELMRRRVEGPLQQHSQVLSLRTMAEETMGPVGAWVTTAIYLMLSYTLLVAYISKSGELVSLLLHVPDRAAADLLFTVALGGVLCAGGAKMADSVNQVLTITLLGLFVLIVFGGAAMADWTGFEHMDWTQAPQTLPIIFLALVYHDLTPVVCAQLGGDIGRIRMSIILGSLVPLVMFLSWDAVALCITPLLGAKDPIDVFIRVGGPGPALVVELFAFIAVATSFIGTVLGLQEFFLEQWSARAAQGSTTTASENKLSSVEQPLQFEWWNRMGPRAVTSLLVLAPPLVASSLVTDAFFSASDLAGAYGMTSLYGVIPPLMAWGLQNSSNKLEHDPQSMSRLLGDRATLATVGACAMAIILGQVMLDIFPPSPPPPVVVAEYDKEIRSTPTSSDADAIFTTLAAP